MSAGGEFQTRDALSSIISLECVSSNLGSVSSTSFSGTGVLLAGECSLGTVSKNGVDALLPSKAENFDAAFNSLLSLRHATSGDAGKAVLKRIKTIEAIKRIKVITIKKIIKICLKRTAKRKLERAMRKRPKISTCVGIRCRRRVHTN